MTTPPPPPPGSGSNPPYDPSGSAPPPAGQGQGQPSYGMASGQPPQAPPPAPGGAPQGESDKGRTLSIVSLVTGIIGVVSCCCFVFGIAAVVTGILAKKDTTDEQSLKFAKIGVILGIVGIVLGAVVWIYSLVTGGFEYRFEAS